MIIMETQGEAEKMLVRRGILEMSRIESPTDTDTDAY